MNLTSAATRFCNNCMQMKTEVDFYSDSSRPDGLTPYCKECCKVFSKRWRDNNLVKMKRYMKGWKLKSTYGVSIEEYNELLLQQNNRCYLCDEILMLENDNRVHLDHDKETGKIYGVACNYCNAGIGFFGHSHEKMIRVAERMKKVRK